MSKSNFSKIIENLKPDLLMYDLYQQWAEEIAHSHKVHAVKLLTCTAAFLSHFFRSYRKPEVEPPFPAIYSSEIEQRRFDKMIDIAVGKGRDPEDKDFFSGGNKQIALTSTSKAIEAKYIEYLQGVKCYGKLIPVGSPIQDDQGPDLMVENDELIDWLGKKDEHSTVFVSFGSEHFLSKEDLEELAFGLVHCGVNFIWVVRFPKDGEEEVALPKGFLEKIGDRGRVVNGWAPQKKILSHPSTGGFLSHCGFNSVMESIGFGVPIIAMPIHLDQPINARLMVQLGVAVEIVRDDQGKVEGEEIAQLLKSVIGHERGDALRMRVRDLRENTHSTSGKEMDEAVEELIKLCKNKVQ